MIRSTSAGSLITDPADSERLLTRLDGPPLLIAQAGVYMHERRISVTKYLQHYELRWNELMKWQRRDATPVQDYPSRSVATTW
jgi:hypothetical protein